MIDWSALLSFLLALLIPQSIVMLAVSFVALFGDRSEISWGLRVYFCYVGVISLLSLVVGFWWFGWGSRGV